MSELVEIGSIAAVRQGRYTAPGEMSERPSPSMMFPVWGANGILGYTSNATYEEAQPLVTCRGNGCGLVQWSAGRAHVSNNAMAIVLTNADPLSSKYLYYSLLANDFLDVITGSAQPQITMGHLTRKKIFWHKERNERTAIAHILGTLDDKIELNRKTNETLEAIAKALFKSWFVDFDPVRAKAEGRPTGLPAEISDLFPDSFEESELGEIPKGWEVVKLNEVADINYGQNLPQPKLMEHGIPVFGAAGVIGYYSEAMFTEPIVLVTSRGSGSGTVHETHGPAFVTNNSFSVTPKAGWFSRHYIRESLLNGDIVSLVTGSAQPQLTITNFSHLKIILPTESVVTSFHEITESLWKRKLTDQEETYTLAALRDTLLPKLISGELRVPDAEALVAEAGL